MSKHFLVVDDSELNLRVVQTLLDKYGISADYVTSAEQAFKALESGEYDLVLMDYLMPGMNGIDATAHIRKMKRSNKDDYFKQLPIIALTAEDSSQLQTTMVKAGVNDIMIKPIEASAFTRIVDKWAPTVHGIDEATLMGMIDADRNSYIELITMFCADVDGKKERVDAALAAGDYQNYTVEVHKIKGEARLIGAAALSEVAKTLEFAGKSITGVIPNGKSNDDNIALIRSKTPAIFKGLNCMRTELEKLINDYTAPAPAAAAKDKSSATVACSDSDLAKIGRYAAHAIESLEENDLKLTREWLDEINELVAGLLSGGKK